MSSGLAKQYQRKTDREHVLDNPDTYCGSMELTEYTTGLLHSNGDSISTRTVNIIPGLYKLFDEAIVNARDHYIRLKSQSDCQGLTYIDVEISDSGIIRIKNDGPGIPVEKHPVYGMWIPELIFANLRTSSNYNKSEKKRTGGKNGFGVKILFIWSVWGKLITVDSRQSLKYEQEYSDNLQKVSVPKITRSAGKSYTQVEFKPDFERMGISSFSPEMLAILRRRVYDIAATTDKAVKVRLNGRTINIKTFESYVSLYIGDKSAAKRVYEKANDDWEYAVALSSSEKLEQISFFLP